MNVLNNRSRAASGGGPECRLTSGNQSDQFTSESAGMEREGEEGESGGGGGEGEGVQSSLNFYSFFIVS